MNKIIFLNVIVFCMLADQAHAGHSARDLAPPAQFPSTCTIDPVAGKTAFDSWTADYAQYKALPPGFGDAENAACPPTNTVVLGQAGDQWCNGKPGTVNSPGGSFLCTTPSQDAAIGKKYLDCLNNFYKNNAAKYQPIDAQYKAIGAKIQQDETAYNKACVPTPAPRAVSAACTQVAQLYIQLQKDRVSNTALVDTDVQAFQTARTACDASQPRANSNDQRQPASNSFQPSDGESQRHQAHGAK